MGATEPMRFQAPEPNPRQMASPSVLSWLHRPATPPLELTDTGYLGDFTVLIQSPSVVAVTGPCGKYPGKTVFNTELILGLSSRIHSCQMVFCESRGPRLPTNSKSQESLVLNHVWEHTSVFSRFGRLRRFKANLAYTASSRPA